MRGAIDRVTSTGAVETKYKNCGRKKGLSDAQVKGLVAFVTTWHHKRCCTCAYVKRELKLKIGKRAIAKHLNNAGVFWRPVPNKDKFSQADLAKRQAFVEKYGHHGPEWWEKALGLVLDGRAQGKIAPTRRRVYAHKGRPRLLPGRLNGRFLQCC